MTAPENARKRHSPSRRRRIILAGTLAACFLAAAAELVTRHVLEDKIVAAAGSKLSGPVSVSIGLTPALVDAATGKIPGVTISASSTTLCGLGDVSATATLTDVSRSHGTVTAQSTRVSAVLTPATLAGQLRRKYPNVAVTTDPAAQTLLISLGRGGLVQIQERASLDGQILQLAPAAISVLGRTLAPTVQITSKLTVRRSLTGLPLGLDPRSVSVTAGGLTLDLAAGPSSITYTEPAHGGTCTQAHARGLSDPGNANHAAPPRRLARSTLTASTGRPETAAYLLAERLAICIQTAQSEQEDGTNPFGLLFPSPKGKYWRSSNFRSNILQRAYLDAGWRDSSGEGRWTRHSLRHGFCTTVLFTWKLEPTDVSRMARHVNYRITLSSAAPTMSTTQNRAMILTRPSR